MHIVVYCLDHPDVIALRRTHFAAHKARLETSPLHTVIAGPLTEPDGTIVGSFFLYDAHDIETVRAFVLEDPFNIAGIWKTVDIRCFEKRAGRC
ncbi:YciI family protein [Paraburkholderia tagetis]|uniref:YciI family protein n=1 Tax=Paraburkholderia tagetis TaxID=2913261 RepID=A0A9X1ZY66_9BURK|nr:YciI family protein [Paraburkholderia tagetis]MCG5078167.1 YciI family protein [Paraburkholderia tagetis]